jgi:hypothetical protein
VERSGRGLGPAGTAEGGERGMACCTKKTKKAGAKKATKKTVRKKKK